MAAHSTSIMSRLMSRIEWCRLQETQAGTPSELEGWRAEQEGLRDAILNREHTNPYRYSPPALVERYAIGLEDGRALMRLARADKHVPTIPQKEECMCDPHGDLGEGSSSSIMGNSLSTDTRCRRRDVRRVQEPF
jgi:hypothetical protein